MESQNKEYYDIVSQLTPPSRTPSVLPPPPKPYNADLTHQISSLMLHPCLEALLHLFNDDLHSAHFLVRHMQAEPMTEGMYLHAILHRLEGDYNNCRAWYGNVCASDVFLNFWGADNPETKKGLWEESMRACCSQKEMDGLAGEVQDPPEDEDISDGSKDADGSMGAKLKFTLGEGKEQNKVPSQTQARAFVSGIEELKNKKSTSEGYEDRKEALMKVSIAEMKALSDWCVNKFGTRKMQDASKVWVQPSEHIKSVGEDMVTGDQGHRDF